MATYNAEAAEFLDWLKHSGLAETSELKDEAVLDAMAVKYLATSFDEGESYATAAAVVFGLIFKFGLPKSRTVLPRSRRARLGFRKDDPEVSRDPCPEEAAVLLVDDLLLQDASTMGGDLACLMAASAITLQMDLTSRPSETLALTREKVVPPQGKKFARMAVIFHPQDPKRSQTSKVTNKSGSVDDTVMSAACGAKNHVFTQVLSALHIAARPRERLLSPLTLAAYERIAHASAGRCGFEALNIVPHSFRHGSASSLLHGKVLDQAGLMARMRVFRKETVRRYAKTGKLQRQVAAMGIQRRLTGEAALIAPGRPANPFFELAHRLADLRSRRLRAGV